MWENSLEQKNSWQNSIFMDCRNRSGLFQGLWVIKGKQFPDFQKSSAAFELGLKLWEFSRDLSRECWSALNSSGILLSSLSSSPSAARGLGKGEVKPGFGWNSMAFFGMFFPFPDPDLCSWRRNFDSPKMGFFFFPFFSFPERFSCEHKDGSVLSRFGMKF